MYSRTSLRRSGSVAIVHGDILELVEHVRPCLEQLYPLWPIGRTIVCAADIVLVLVRKGRLDYVGIEASFVEGCIFSIVARLTPALQSRLAPASMTPVA